MSRLTIDLDALAANYHTVAREAGGAEMAPVVKADGYGLGAGEVSRRLWTEGARKFFVARAEEGEHLRQALEDRDAGIFVFDGARPGARKALLSSDLTPVLTSVDQVAYWGSAPSALNVETGMNRAGVTHEEAAELAASGYSPLMVMSHLGSAADPASPRNAMQLERFRAALSLFPNAAGSLSASAGVFLGPDYHFDIVRPGVSLYGSGPREVPDERIAAVATLEADIWQFRELSPGEQAGYGVTFTARRPTRLAILGGGYADGIIRQAHEGAKVWLNGGFAPIAFVTMDLIGVDITDGPDAALGDVVELLGENAKLDDLAAAAGSVPHETLVRLSARGHRVYLGGED